MFAAINLTKKNYCKPTRLIWNLPYLNRCSTIHNDSSLPNCNTTGTLSNCDREYLTATAIYFLSPLAILFLILYLITED